MSAIAGSEFLQAGVLVALVVACALPLSGYLVDVMEKVGPFSFGVRLARSSALRAVLWARARMMVWIGGVFSPVRSPLRR